MSAAIRIEYIFWLVAALLAICAFKNLAERRWAMAAFWGVIACAFAFGELIRAASAAGQRGPAQAMGAGVIALGLLAMGGSRAAVPGAADPPAADIGNRLFLPALAIPLATLVIVLVAPWLHVFGMPLIDASQPTLVALGLACVIALAAALRTTGARVGEAFSEGRRLLDALGSVALLPMVLATLGSVFAATGVGDVIAHIVGMTIPIDNRLACLAAFAFGMVVFTMIMGNAFAAFPVMMAGIGVPLLVVKHGALPAVLGSLGMLTGYCGTLLTPMAANFNIVPAVLLELPDQYAVIRAQIPTALILLCINVALMALLVFR
ncbi:MAG: DUF979 family protein [Rudaea sp.]